MAKSKTQKREEAIQRARKALPGARLTWLKYQPGGNVYVETAKHNKEHADMISEQATVSFKEAAARAHTDLHGNPL